MDMYDCVVVGAGYAGLSAAKSLTENNKKVLLLEARDRVGGRSWTKTYPDGTYEDLGGAWLSPRQQNMYKLAEEFGVRTFDVNTQGKTIFSYGGKVTPYKSPLLPPLNPLALVDAGLLLHAFDQLSQTVNIEEPWEAKDAKWLDMMTVDQWVRAHGWTTSAKDTMRMACELIWGVSTSQISMLHALWYCKAGVSLTVLSTIENGAQQQMVVGGAQTLANRIKDKLGEVVKLNEPVTAVDQSAEDVVLITTQKGSYRARCVIMAIPPQLILPIEFTPLLPAQKIKLLQNSPMGAYWKVYACYDRPFWRDNDLRGEAVCPDAYMTLINDMSPVDGSRGVLVGFIVASKAMEFLDMSKEQREGIVMEEFRACYGTEATAPKKLTLHTMMEERWSTGCPVAVPSPGQWTSVGKWVQQPVGRVHWAGTETATSWSGYMEGAVHSGLRASKEVLQSLE